MYATHCFVNKPGKCNTLWRRTNKTEAEHTPARTHRRQAKPPANFLLKNRVDATNAIPRPGQSTYELLLSAQPRTNFLFLTASIIPPTFFAESNPSHIASHPTHNDLKSSLPTNIPHRGRPLRPSDRAQRAELSVPPIVERSVRVQ